MILISRTRQIILLIAVLISLALITGFSVYYLEFYPDSGNLSAQLRAEIVLIIAICSLALNLVLAVALLRSGRDAVRTLNKYINADPLQNPGKDFGDEISGKAGKELFEIYKTLIEYNRKRSIKINSMSLLIRFLTNIFDKPACVLDGAGFIIYRNQSFPSQNEKPGLTNIVDIEPELDLKSLMAAMFGDRKGSEVRVAGESFRIFPVFGRQDSIAYMVVTAEKDVQARIAEQSFKPAKAANGRTMTSRFKKFFFGQK